MFPFALVFSDLYCYSCFGFDQDDPKKCELSENREVRKCPNVTGEAPVCVKFTGTFHLPEKTNDEILFKDLKGHGFHCGTRKSCDDNKCPKQWHDVTSNCDIVCCDDSVSCPLPGRREIDRAQQFQQSTRLAQGQVGARAGKAAIVVWSDWLKAVTFASFGWFKLH